MYAGLATMLIFEFRLAKKENIVKSPKGFIVCFVLPLLLGGIIEILQPLYFAPRTGSWMDFSFNFFGVILAWVFMRQFGKLVNRIFVWRKSR